jgi:RNA recognition motif-containing protein
MISYQEKMIANKTSQWNFSKIFVGGLSNKTTQASLKNYFSSYGEVKKCVIIQKEVGQNGSFGFVTFADARKVEIVLNNAAHYLDGR